ncbi:hypothetical protein ECANGB1_2731 [Enterospora canceri]|uniref:Secreted protein n=1 Tax=Enterospora canceri TaxID=1081671 RepID=A0A1Y1S4I8_9MICR|nr:hypothetical protein ECANGB1_2731 [Enterospora canceri]
MFISLFILSTNLLVVLSAGHMKPIDWNNSFMAGIRSFLSGISASKKAFATFSGNCSWINCFFLDSNMVCSFDKCEFVLICCLIPDKFRKMALQRQNLHISLLYRSTIPCCLNLIAYSFNIFVFA